MNSSNSPVTISLSQSPTAYQCPPLDLTPTLPGISKKCLEDAKVMHCREVDVYQWCGISAPGIILPYRDSRGNLIQDLHGAFARVRLDSPKDCRKYHQRTGTSSHAYIPPAIWKYKRLQKVCHLVEGEKKALSMSDAGFCAIGLGGFFNFKNKDGSLVTELADLLPCFEEDTKFVFLGDKDVLTNFQFYQAACQLRELLSQFQFAVTCVPLDAPGKGVDDCRAALGDGFTSWCTSNLQHVAVERQQDTAKLALNCIENKWPTIVAKHATDRDGMLQNLIRLTVALENQPLEKSIMIQRITGLSGIGKRDIRKAVTIERGKLRDKQAQENGEDDIPVVDLSEPVGVWTSKVLQIIGPLTFYYSERLCSYEGSKFRPFTAASIASFVDQPTICRFVKKSGDGALARTSLSEKEGRLLVESPRSENLHLLRQVDFVAPAPVLAWTVSGTETITGYSKHHRILAEERLIIPFQVATAVTVLNDVLRDFRFATAGDEGRALAFLLTPALVRGGFLDTERSPFFFLRKNLPGTGGGIFMKMVASIYHSKPHSIIPRDEKTAKEDISKLLLDGASLIYLDNMTGTALRKMPFLESLLTEPIFLARALFRHHSIDVSRTVFACTSNGALLSTDLATRSVDIAMCKQPEGYSFYSWPEGGLLNRVAELKGLYLNAVYILIKDWAQRGRPSGPGLTGFRFSAWEKACSWILNHHFSLPLLDSAHQIAQQRLADPNHDYVRALLQCVVKSTSTDTYSTTELVKLAICEQLLPSGASVQDEARRLGRILSKYFPDDGRHTFCDEFEVVLQRHKCGPEGNYELIKVYSIRSLRPQSLLPASAIAPDDPNLGPAPGSPTPPPLPPKFEAPQRIQS